jgi:DNA-binding NtrC family response regulator
MRDIGADHTPLKWWSGRCDCRSIYATRIGVRVVTLRPYVGANEQPRRRTILLVEDEPFVLDATTRILESAGFDVLPAEDPPAARRVFAEREADINLVMTDMVLPGQSGEQLAHDLREKSPELVVLVTSGYGNPDYETESPELRTYFLPKPYSKRLLIDKIEKILEKHLRSQPATQTR